MAHFAELDSDNKVLRVIVIDNSNASDEFGTESEAVGVEYITALLGSGNWKKTSYNTFGGQHSQGGVPIRKNFAGINYLYDESRDAFIPPSKYPSWILNEDTCLWDPPVPHPTPDSDSDTRRWYWDETSQQWVEE